MIQISRIPYVFLALLSLLVGLYTGLTRIGWNAPLLPSTLHHGSVMVGGFLGTLISLEKVIPLKNRILFAIPLTGALSTIFFSTGFQLAGMICLMGASLGLVYIFLTYLRQEKTNIYWMMLAGAMCWVVGNSLLFTNRFYPVVTPWWMAFLVFVISAERIELMRFLPVTSTQKKLFYGILVMLVISLLISFHGPGKILYGISLIAISLWLFRYDLISITIKKEKLTRFVAIALFAGYCSLLFTGVLMLSADMVLAYDAVIHTFFLGFVLSMIFAHGPIILPGVLGIFFKPYNAILYMWLLFLHTSWMIRVYGDLFADPDLRKISGIITAFAIIAYFITLATLIIRNRHAKV